MDSSSSSYITQRHESVSSGSRLYLRRQSTELSFLWWLSVDSSFRIRKSSRARKQNNAGLNINSVFHFLTYLSNIHGATKVRQSWLGDSKLDWYSLAMFCERPPVDTIFITSYGAEVGLEEWNLRVKHRSWGSHKLEQFKMCEIFCVQTWRYCTRLETEDWSPDATRGFSTISSSSIASGLMVQ